MRLRHIEIFHAVFSHGSITAAAKFLYISQPAVSKILSHAESQLGFLLFDRIKGRLSPTSEAILLFGEVDRIYQQINTVNDVAENIKHHKIGRISLALTPALGFEVMPTLIADFIGINPQVSYDIQTVHNDFVHEHLQKHKSELAIMFAPHKYPHLNQVFCGRGRLVIVYPKSLLPDEPSKISLNDLTQYRWISIGNSGPLASLLRKKLTNQNITLSDTLKVHTLFIAVSLVNQGVGICIVDQFTAKSQLTDNIAIAEIEEELEFPIKGLFLKNKPLSQVTSDFLETAREKFLTV